MDSFLKGKGVNTTEKITNKHSLVNKLQRVHIQHKINEFWVASSINTLANDAAANQPVNIGADVSKLLEQGISFKPMPGGETPQWVRTLLEITSQEGAGRNKGLATENARLLSNALDQMQKATRQLLIESSKIYALYNPQLTKEENQNPLVVQVLGRYAQNGVEKHFKDQTLQRNIRNSIELIKDSSEIVSIQAKVIGLNNPALLDPRLYNNRLSEIQTSAPLYGSLIAGVDGTIKLGIHSSVFAQFAIDNDGDVVQLGIIKEKGKSIFETAKAAFFQKSPNLRDQGGLRLVNNDMHRALREGTDANGYVTDPMSGRKLLRQHAEASINMDSWVDMITGVSQFKMLEYDNEDKRTIFEPFAITLDDINKMGSRYQNPNDLLTGIESGRVKISHDDGFSVLKMDSHGMYKEDDLDSVVGALLNPRNREYAEMRQMFLNHTAELEKGRILGKVAEVADLSSGAAAGEEVAWHMKLLANTWYNFQSSKTLPQAMGNKTIGILTNSAVIYEMLQAARDLSVKEVWQQDDWKTIGMLQDVVASDLDAFKSLKAVRQGLLYAQNRDSHLFATIEVGGLKVVNQGTVATPRDAFKGEDPRVLVKDLADIFFGYKKRTTEEGFEASLTEARMIYQHMYNGQLPPELDFLTVQQNSFEAFASLLGKKVKEGGLDAAFTIQTEPKLPKQLPTPQENLENYSKRINKFGVRSRRARGVTQKNLFERLLDLGVYEFKTLSTSVDDIGESNVPFYKGTYALVTRDIAGNYRSAGAAAGGIGVNPIINGVTQREQELETSIYNTVALADYTGPDSLMTGEVRTFDPRDILVANTDDINEKPLEVTIQNKKKGETVYNFLLGDFSGIGYDQAGRVDSKKKGITLDLFDMSSAKFDKSLAVTALERLIDKSDGNSPLLRKFLDVGDMGTDSELLNKAIVKVSKLIQEGNTTEAMRILTLGFARKEEGLQSMKNLENQLTVASDSFAHTGRVIVGESSVAQYYNAAGSSSHGASITLANVHGPAASEHEFLMMSLMARANGMSLTNSFKDTSQVQGGIRTWFNPNENTGRRDIGVPGKRFPKVSGQVIKSVELNERVMYIAPNMFEIDMQDPATNKAFNIENESDYSQMFRDWEHFFFDPDGQKNPDGTDIANNLEKKPGAAQMTVYKGHIDKFRDAVDGQRYLQEYEKGYVPSKEEKASSIFDNGRWYKVIKGEDLSPDAKLVNQSGFIKIAPTSTMFDAFVDVGGKNLRVDSAISLGEIGSKMTDPMAIIYVHGRTKGLSDDQILDIIRTYSPQIANANTPAKKQVIIDQMLEEVGLLRGVHTNKSGVKTSVLVTADESMKLNPLTNPAEHNLSKEVKREVIRKRPDGTTFTETVYEYTGNPATMSSKGGGTGAITMSKLSEGSAAIISYLYKGNTGNGPEALAAEIMQSNPELKTPEEAIEFLRRSLEQEGSDHIMESLRDSTEQISKQLHSVIQLNLQLAEQQSNAHLTNSERQNIRLKMEETQKIAKDFGHLIGGADKAGVIQGRAEVTKNKVDQEANNMYNALKNMSQSSKSTVVAGATIAAAGAFIARSRQESKKNRAEKR